jgi:hypothetical protein
MVDLTGVETEIRPFSNSLTASELWSQAVESLSLTTPNRFPAVPFESPRIDPVRGDILETVESSDLTRATQSDVRLDRGA